MPAPSICLRKRSGVTPALLYYYNHGSIITGRVSVRSIACRQLDKSEAYLNSRSETERKYSFPDALARIYLLRDQTDQALDEVQTIFDDGRISRWWERDDLMHHTLKDDPRYQKMIAGIRADVAKMREKLSPDVLAAP